MPEIKLTQDQMQKILADYHAEQHQRSRLNQQQLEAIASKLNEKIDVPIIGEKTEEVILIKIVKKVDGFLYDHLPNEIYDSIRDLEGGLTDEEAQNMIDRLTDLATRMLTLPYLPKPVEEIAIKFILGLIINGMRKKWDLYKAADNADKVTDGEGSAVLAAA